MRTATVPKGQVPNLRRPGKPRCEPSVIPLGAPLTSGSLLIYPSVLAMADCDVARRVRAPILRVVAGVDSRRSLRAPRNVDL